MVDLMCCQVVDDRDDAFFQLEGLGVAMELDGCYPGDQKVKAYGVTELVLLHTPSSTLRHTTRSPFRMMTVTFSKLTVNV